MLGFNIFYLMQISTAVSLAATEVDLTAAEISADNFDSFARDWHMASLKKLCVLG